MRASTLKVTPDPVGLYRSEREKRRQVRIAPVLVEAKYEFEKHFADSEQRRQRAIAIAIATKGGKKPLTPRQKMLMQMDDEALLERANGRWHTGTHS